MNNPNKICNSIWIKREGYFEHKSKQGTPDWLAARVGRINSSNTGSMAGHSKFKDPEETGKIIAGVTKENFNEKNQEYMNHGTVQEPKARRWYENKYNCKVIERGLCVPFWDPEIGASIDGEVYINGEKSEGLIEIKSPQKMYPSLEKYSQSVSKGWKPPKNYTDHIFKTHLFQMMQAMAVLRKKWCDYVVYDTTSEQVFVQRVYFDPNLWNSHYIKIKENYNRYVRPHLPKNLPLLPS
jgi:hypothetical protein